MLSVEFSLRLSQSGSRIGGAEVAHASLRCDVWHWLVVWGHDMRYWWHVVMVWEVLLIIWLRHMVWGVEVLVQAYLEAWRIQTRWVERQWHAWSYWVSYLVGFAAVEGWHLLVLLCVERLLAKLVSLGVLVHDLGYRSFDLLIHNWIGASLILRIRSYALLFVILLFAIEIALWPGDGLMFLHLELLVVIVWLLCFITIELLEFFIDLHEQPVHLWTSIIVFLSVFWADANIQWVLAFNLTGTFLEARTFSS